MRSCNEPHFPLAFVVDQIGLEDAAVLPLFIGDEGWFGLIEPLFAVPFQKSNGVWSPEVVGRSGVINPLDPLLFGGVPPVHIRWAVPSAVAIPRTAALPSGEWR